MTFDDATVMAYADGELSLLERKHVEQAMASDPVLAERVASYAGLGNRIRDAFAPVAQAPVPDRLSTLVASNVVRLDRRPRAPRRWGIGLALAASLVLGLGLGTQWNGMQRPITVAGGTLVAAGPLAHALDTQLASASGDVRILVSFRSTDGYCRVFASHSVDGIACHTGDHWQLRQTRSGRPSSDATYRQAASADAPLMIAAQEMMTGTPLDTNAERRARAAGWH